jgi:hypothetical protein
MVVRSPGTPVKIEVQPDALTLGGGLSGTSSVPKPDGRLHHENQQ